MELLTALVVLAALATAGALATGVGSMVHGGAFDQRHADQFMVARVGLQGLAFILLLLALLVAA
ncbi:MAG: hypothetical protein GWO39_08420 [Gammaproteobacteria bacterium]|nr:hypothetical protein [Gemmatimonadota bacterium]NIR98104.1 hypothetical protein [Gammaproteobacteria bacterium]NIT63797.1 hypothetical protein [Gammaproteobacteria bacterium]NIV20752.1 hypothetical protein [Gammaproteobacteria bacterium]NIY32377.1 hypothetical protein [Gammaproteobacteria bacterium]